MKHATMCQTDTPSVYVTKGKQRIKQFNETVYLEVGNFELELFNPLTCNVLAKIELNGDSIGNGIILRPGERVFLERYLDTNKKFKFDTYTVSANNNQVKQAIKNNGNVRVKFYKEKPLYTCNNTNMWSTGNTYTNYPIYGTCTTSSMLYDANVSFTTSGNVGIGISSPSQTLEVAGNVGIGKELPSNTFYSSPQIETGRIEKGGVSDQKLTSVDMEFEYSPFHTVTWKILPKSQQLVTSSDIKQYCPECGTRIKKSSYKFCPTCGNKLQ